MTNETARLPYDLRVQIGRALDRLICDDSTPEQVDQFIATFADFGLIISSDTDFGTCTPPPAPRALPTSPATIAEGSGE